MNKKGFAISIILYSLVFLLISIFVVTLGILKTRYTVSNGLRNSIIADLGNKLTLYDIVANLGDDASIDYVQKYDISKGAPNDLISSDGDKDIYYYTSNTNANLPGQNGNVIFGDFCWQIVRTTTDGGVRLIYNGLKTNDNKCPNNVSARPAYSGFVGAASTPSTVLSDSKIYGENFDIFDDNGTKKFRLLNTNSYTWSDSTYQNILNKFVCGTSSAVTGTTDTCEVMYAVVQYENSTKAKTTKFTIGSPGHFSFIGKGAFNSMSNSIAYSGYMYNDVYLKKSKNMYSTKTMLTRESVSNKYYYGDTATWNSSTSKYDVTLNGSAPTTSTAWADIRSNVQGMYTCKNTTDTSCAKVYYVVDNATDNYMYAVELSNNENIDTKSITLNYSSSYSKSGNNYTLTNPTSVTILYKNWHSVYESYNGVYTCSDYTSSTCTKLYYLGPNYKNQLNYNQSSNNYYYGYSVTYANGSYTIDTNNDPTKYHQIWEWYKDYNTIDSSHYTCFNANSNVCDGTVYFVFKSANNVTNYLELTNGDKIENALEKMLNTSNSSSSSINRYSSTTKTFLESWYETNLLELSDYLDMDAVYCNHRNIKSYGGYSKTGSTVSNSELKYVYYDKPSYGETSITCPNITDRFSVNNNVAKIKYPVGLLSEPERALMQSPYDKTGSLYRLSTPYVTDGDTVMRIVNTSGYSEGAYGTGYYYAGGVYGIRPVITLKPAIVISGGEGTYDEPYLVKTN